MDINVKEEGWVEKLFSREGGFEEDTPKVIVNLGELSFIVEDNAGSITLTLNNETEEVKVKLLYKGSFGPSEEGEGTLYSNLQDNLYSDRVDFATYSEGFNELEKYLNRYIVI